MIDNNGFRKNVGIIICNRYEQVLWARRYGKYSWQFPQGGVDYGESSKQTMYRELYEEIGLLHNNVKLLAFNNHWLCYKLPKHLIRWNKKPICIGQKQKWFLLEFKCNESDINMQNNKSPEFDSWKWVSYWYPIRYIVSFKREVYRLIMKKFSSIVISLKTNIN
ncbi:RNA pyrophosphohydrolase [Candidatus Providencia siddallii]|uniref:RNA pyrophosphohydrolase n=1 Tax=Candidatus Providencia siddallii TaxID=1715285 RepID=A0ABP1CDZ5_9GAMM